MSYRLPPEAAGYKAKGLLIVGTAPRCGKTVAAAGIAGALCQLGFRAQALKPLSFLPKVSIREGQEQAFFNRVVPPLESSDPVVTESAHAVSATDWQRLTEGCRKRMYSYILEMPGSAASPLRFAGAEVSDVADFARALELPILVVTARQPDVLAALAPTFAYLWHRDAKVLGWIAVGTTAPDSPMQAAPDWDMETLYLNHHYQVPYLGEIAHSPSISVEALQQGNLLRTTEMGVDLLPIQQALDLLIP